MSNNLYKETFSHVTSSYEFKLEDFEKMKTNKKVFPIRKTMLIAAAVAVLAALGITASATGFFGMSDIVMEKNREDGGIISMLGLTDTAESKALGEYLDGVLSLEAAAEKYGLTVPERCETFTYEDMKKLQGGELFDERHERWAAFIYENGTFGMDGEYKRADGTTIGYQLFRSVKGSLVDTSLQASALGDDPENWNIDVDGTKVCLVLGDSKSIIAADFDGCFVIINVLTGTQGDNIFGGPISRAELEELAGSINWEVLSRVNVPDLPPEIPAVKYGADVVLNPEYIWEGQSFEEVMPGWGKTNFITYRPTPEFDDVRFFLSEDGRVSDYEFHPMYNDSELKSVAAVSFEDLNGDNKTDVLVLLDYVSPAGQAYRDVRIFTYLEGKEYGLEWELMDSIKADIPNDKLDVRAVRDYCKKKMSVNDLPAGDSVLKTIEFAVAGRGDQKDIPMELDVIGKAGGDGRYGVSELRIYDMSAIGRTKPAQIIRLADIGEDFVSGSVGEGYTDCWSVDEAVNVLDMNFDGSPDIEVFGWVTNNTIPHYYFFWHSEAGRFEYALRLQGATVDKENGQVIAEYKSGEGGSEYTRDYYKPDKNGNLVLVDSKKTTYSGNNEPLPDDSGKPNDYAGVLAALDRELAKDALYREYAMFDITGDHYPELIVVTGANEAEATARVYTMEKGGLMVLGEFGMSHSLLYDKDGKLIKLEGHMGYETISEIGYNGYVVTEKELSHRLLGRDDEYAVPGTAVPTADVGDSWLLDGVGQYTGYDAILDKAPEGAKWATFDMDFDGVRELIVSDGDSWTFYTAKGGRAEEIGELDSAHSSLHIYGDDHTLGLYYSNMSGAEISRVYKGDGKIVVIRVTGWEWREGVAGEDPGPELGFKDTSKRDF